MSTVFQITIHSSKADDETQAEIDSLRLSLTDDSYKSVFDDRLSFIVTIIGFGTTLSRHIVDGLLGCMKLYSTHFPEAASDLKLLRVNQRAEWCQYFMTKVCEEERLITSLDIEIHTEIDSTFSSNIEQLLRENKVKDLQLQTAPFPFGSDFSHERLIAALQENLSLQRLLLDMFFPSGGCSKTFQSLMIKPQLAKVSLPEPETQEDLESLMNLLSHTTCSIQELTLVRHYSPRPAGAKEGGFLCTFKDMPLPNKSIRTFRWLRSDALAIEQVESILSSFVGIEVLSVQRTKMTSLPFLNQSSKRIPRGLRILDITGSELVKKWENLDDDELDLVYGSLIQYRMTFPNLQIVGFPANHRVFRDFPKYLEQQEFIAPTSWPSLFKIMDIVRQPSYQSYDHRNTDPSSFCRTSIDISHGILKHYFMRQWACG